LTLRAPNAATIERKLFEVLAPHGIYIAQTIKPISAVSTPRTAFPSAKRFGGNRACRPVKVGMGRGRSYASSQRTRHGEPILDAPDTWRLLDEGSQRAVLVV
jgi:hypothetical protein